MVGLHLGKQAVSLACMIRLHMISDAKLRAKSESPVIKDDGTWELDLEVFYMSR